MAYPRQGFYWFVAICVTMFLSPFIWGWNDATDVLSDVGAIVAVIGLCFIIGYLYGDTWALKYSAWKRARREKSEKEIENSQDLVSPQKKKVSLCDV